MAPPAFNSESFNPHQDENTLHSVMKAFTGHDPNEAAQNPTG